MLAKLTELRDGGGVLGPLSDAELELLSGCLVEQRCKAGEHLIKVGDLGDRVFIILEGRIRRDHGAELGPGDVAGGVVIFAGGIHTEAAVAASDCRVAALTMVEIERLRAESPEFWQRVSSLVLAYMRKTRLYEVLDDIFGPFDDMDGIRRVLAPEVVWRTLSGGEVLFQQGDEADGVYVVMSGRLRVSVTAGNGDEEVINEVSRGETVGEMAMLSEKRRTATVAAQRDSDVVCISKQGFQLLVERQPLCLTALSRIIIDRLERRSSSEPFRPLPPTCIALVPVNDQAPIVDLAQQLESRLATFGSASLLSSSRVDAVLGKNGIAQAESGHPAHRRLLEWLNEREEKLRFVLYLADTENSEWTQRCFRQADVVLFVAAAGVPPAEAPASVPSTRRALVLVHPAETSQPSGTAAWLDKLEVNEHYHLRHGDADDVARLARVLVGEAVGLVLGGGGARGFAHIGVYRALCEAGVPIDAVCGSSIGATFAAAMAMGWSPDHLVEVARHSFVKVNVLNDYTLPVVSLLKGRKLDRMVKIHFDCDVEDLWRPFFCVSTNLSAGRMQVFDRGPLWKAVRASVALPGVLPPAVQGNDLLIDGGILNNLPIDLLLERPGAGRAIAVDLHVQKDYELAYREVPSAWQILRSRYLPFTRRLRVPGLLTLMMKATDISSIVHAKAVRSMAELYLNPPVGRFGILETASFDELVTLGHDYALERVLAWQQQK